MARPSKTSCANRAQYCSWLSIFLAAMAAATVGESQRPNFVFIFLDDLRLDDMVALPAVKSKIADRGMNATNFFVNTPVCCPSRATLLSGRYPHNNVVGRDSLAAQNHVVPCCMHMDLLFGDVRSSDAPANVTTRTPCSNPGWWKTSWPVRMRNMGYKTGLFGKLYHMGSDSPCGFAGIKYGPFQRKVETNISQPFMLPGWDRQFVYCYPLDQYFWNRFLDQTTLIGTTDAAETYATALIGNKTIEWLRNDAIPAAKNGVPFFAYVPLHPPHGNTQPAPWYNETWPKSWGIGQDNPIAKSKPNYGYRATDHHWLIATEPPITSQSAAATAKTFVQRLQMLLSVDDVVDEITELLQSEGVLDSTYMIMSADHGWNLGEFRVMSGKHQMYEHTIRVPFAIAGPGIAPGSTTDQVVAMVDIMPTVLELAGAPVKPDDDKVDGRSFAPVLLGRPDGRDRSTMLVEFYSLEATAEDMPPCGRSVQPGCFNTAVSHSDCTNNTFIGLRIVNGSHDWSYAEYTDVRDLYDFEKVYWRELFDLSTDPFQLHNIYYDTPAEVRQELNALLRSEFSCRGSSCRW